MSAAGGLWLDLAGSGVYGRDADGMAVLLVAPGEGFGPGYETPTAALWRAAGYGRLIDERTARWRAAAASGEIRRYAMEAAARRVDAIRELWDLAVRTGTAAPVVELLQLAEEGGAPVPAWVADAARAAARIQVSALDTVEAALSSKGSSWGRWFLAGSAVYLGGRLIGGRRR